MAFSVGSKGNILEQFTNAVKDALGIGSSDATKGSGDLFAREYGGAVDFDPSRWTGNTYAASGRKPLQYGFAILKSNDRGTLALKQDATDTFYLQVAPQSIQQKEIFATNVSASRKGVLVESEGVVFKDIILSGNTGIFPGERAAGLNPVPNFSNPTAAPLPPSGVDPSTGKSQRSPVVSGYEEFLKLRQFFLKYARLKVDSKGQYFFAFINQKDNQFLIVEPLDFTMERNARSPLTYDYRIVMKAIGLLDDAITNESENPGISLLQKLSNVAANVSATLGAVRVGLNEFEGLLISLTQALDDTFVTPVRQLKMALDAFSSGSATVLSLPSTLASNYERVSGLTLAVAEQKDSVNSSTNNFAVGKKNANQNTSLATSFAYDDLGNLTNTGPSQLFSNSNASLASQDAAMNDSEGSILNADGSLSTSLTPKQYTQVLEILNQLDSDPMVPIPRSFVEELKTSTVNIRNDLADLIGVGSDEYNSIVGRTVTKLASPLSTPTDEQFRLLGMLQDVVSALDKILCNNEFFQSGVDGIYDRAQLSYGAVATLRKPARVREMTIQYGDTLEFIALREYGDATRWVDLIVINNLRAPYILDEVIDDPPEGVKMPGDTLLLEHT